MFKKQLDDVNIKFGRRTILSEALQVFRQVFWDVSAKKIRNRYGTIAYKIGECYLVAKKSTYGDIVSVHQKIWDAAKRKGGMIYLYLQSSGYFYRFNPRKQIEMVINKQGEVPMVNFDIRYGKNLLQMKAIQHRIRERVRKNQQYLEKEDPILKTAIS